MVTEIAIGIDYVDSNTPSLPNAKRGDYSGSLVIETKEQLDAGLVWWRCLFCGGYVLIDSTRQARERCQCGAKRINHYHNTGWKLGSETGWYL